MQGGFTEFCKKKGTKIRNVFILSKEKALFIVDTYETKYEDKI